MLISLLYVFSNLFCLLLLNFLEGKISHPNVEIDAPKNREDKNYLLTLLC